MPRKTSKPTSLKPISLAAAKKLLGPKQASELIKSYASKQRIRINIPDESLATILKNWDDKDPKLPAEISFYVKGRPKINLKVAGYRYRGNTCCV